MPVGLHGAEQWAQGPLEDVRPSDHPWEVCFWLFGQRYLHHDPAGGRFVCSSCSSLLPAATLTLAKCKDDNNKKWWKKTATTTSEKMSVASTSKLSTHKLMHASGAISMQFEGVSHQANDPSISVQPALPSEHSPLANLVTFHLWVFPRKELKKFFTDVLCAVFMIIGLMERSASPDLFAIASFT